VCGGREAPERHLAATAHQSRQRCRVSRPSSFIGFFKNSDSPTCAAVKDEFSKPRKNAIAQQKAVKGPI
jgi:hypothetical protein